MGAEKSVLTTGDVARICNVAPRTVSKWVDAGHLRGYRIPGSKDRRIPLDQLIRFMRAHGIPLNGLDGGKRRVLIVDGDEGLSTSLADALARLGEFEPFTASSALEAGAAAEAHHPHVILADVRQSDLSPSSLVRFVRCHPHLRDTSLIAMGAGLGNPQGQGLLQLGFAGFLSKPFGVESLCVLIEHACSTVVAG
mgnify:FL=1